MNNIIWQSHRRRAAISLATGLAQRTLFLRPTCGQTCRTGRSRGEDRCFTTDLIAGTRPYVTQVPFLNFAVVWLGVANSFWKAIVLGTLSPQFRLAVRVLCLTVFCRHRRLPPELLGLDDDD